LDTLNEAYAKFYNP